MYDHKLSFTLKTKYTPRKSMRQFESSSSLLDIGMIISLKSIDLKLQLDLKGEAKMITPR